MRTRNYITRTVQGIYEENGGYGQPITIKRLTEDGVKLQIWTGGGWENVQHVSIAGDIAVIQCPIAGLRTKYTDAVKVRVKPDADHL